MKIFIVFMGLLLVNICATTYKSDFAKYEYLHRALENIANECAEYAAAGGADAEGFANGLLEYSAKKFNNVEVKGYECVISVDGGSVRVYIEMDAGGLFRFFPSSSTCIIAESRYDWK